MSSADEDLLELMSISHQFSIHSPTSLTTTKTTFTSLSDIGKLVRICEHQLHKHINPTNVVAICQASEVFGLTELYDEGLRFMAANKKIFMPLRDEIQSQLGKDALTRINEIITEMEKEKGAHHQHHHQHHHENEKETEPSKDSEPGKEKCITQ